MVQKVCFFLKGPSGSVNLKTKKREREGRGGQRGAFFGVKDLFVQSENGYVILK